MRGALDGSRSDVLVKVSQLHIVRTEAVPMDPNRLLLIDSLLPRVLA